MQEAEKFLDDHLFAEKSFPFGKQKLEAWQKVKAELAQLSHNSRYESALLAYNEYEDLRVSQRDGRSFERWCLDQRLHSAKAPNVS